MNPSLNDSYARVRRAGEHVESLREAIRVFSASAHMTPYFNQVSIPSGTTGIFVNTTPGYVPPEIEMPANIGILVGEVAYNLRAALEYLVYQLAWLDSGTRQEQTSFPSERHSRDWKRRHIEIPEPGHPLDVEAKWTPPLYGVSRHHRELIGTLQPCNGATWVQQLVDLNNPDKHQFIARAAGRGQGVHVTRNTSLTAGCPIPSSDLTATVLLEVAFEDGRLVVEALEALCENVRTTLDSFAPDFPGSGLSGSY